MNFDDFETGDLDEEYEEFDEQVKKIENTDYSWMDKDTAISHYVSALINWSYCRSENESLKRENALLKEELDYVCGLLEQKYGQR